jgi:hypothetical protein
MDHPYLSRRNEIDRARRGLALVGDIIAIASVSRSDHSLLLARKDSLVQSVAVREACARRSFRLGVLLEDLDQLTTNTALASKFGKEWNRFLSSGQTLSKDTLTTLEGVAITLRKVRDQASVLEQDDGSSSYDDYSDSTSDSQSDGRNDTESEEEEEEEEEED